MAKTSEAHAAPLSSALPRSWLAHPKGEMTGIGIYRWIGVLVGVGVSGTLVGVGGMGVLVGVGGMGVLVGWGGMGVGGMGVLVGSGGSGVLVGAGRVGASIGSVGMMRMGALVGRAIFSGSSRISQPSVPWQSEHLPRGWFAGRS